MRLIARHTDSTHNEGEAMRILPMESSEPLPLIASHPPLTSSHLGYLAPEPPVPLEGPRKRWGCVDCLPGKLRWRKGREEEEREWKREGRRVGGRKIERNRFFLASPGPQLFHGDLRQLRGNYLIPDAPLFMCKGRGCFQKLIIWPFRLSVVLLPSIREND